MRGSVIVLCLTALVLTAFAVAPPASDGEIRGPHLGQAPPGKTPEIFAPEIVSTDAREVSSAFTPDGSAFYFARFDASIGYTIMTTKKSEQVWTVPRTAPFSGRYSEVDMFITSSGDNLYFISKRPSEPGGLRSSVYRIWVMERTEDGWGRERVLQAEINSGHRQLYPTLSTDGTLYFGSNRPGGFGGSDIFRAIPSKDGFEAPDNLGATINSEYDETDALIAPDGSFIVFTSVDRPDGYGNGDLYVSFRTPSGAWSEAQNMGPSINTSSSEFCPTLSPDGNYFFFTSGRRGNDDIYWVDASVIRELDPASPDKQ